MAWPKGKKRSAATLRKISEASKKRWANPKYRARLSRIHKKRWEDPEAAERMIAPRRGQKRSAETRKKMSESRRKRRGGHTDPKLIAKMNAARRGSHNTPEHRAATSRAKKQWHEDHPERSREIIDGATKANKYHDNKLERTMAAILDDLGIGYAKQHRARSLPKGHRGHKWDFKVRGERVLIEVDGCFWHGCRRHASDARRRELAEQLRTQRSRDRAARKDGWIVLRFWEHKLTGGRTAVVRATEKAMRRCCEPVAA